jgi:hypothetical protein
VQPDNVGLERRSPPSRTLCGNNAILRGECFMLPDVIQFGSAMIQTKVLVLLASSLLGIFLIKLAVKNEGTLRPIYDILLTAVVIVILFWKFGHVVFYPSILLERPVSFLFMTGGLREIIIGSLFSAIYIWFQIRKHNVPIQLAKDALPFGILGAALIYYLLISDLGRQTAMIWGMSLYDGGSLYHPLHFYRLVLAILLFVWLWTQRRNMGNLVIVRDFLLFFGAGLFGISFFDRHGTTFMFLTYSQWLYTAMAISSVFFLGGVRHTKKKQKRS